MTAAVSARARPGAVVSWYSDAVQAPADTLPPPHPSRTRQWTTAWQHITTEQVLAYRYACVSDGLVRETVPLLLVPPEGSPCWTMLESGTGTGPVWDGPVLYAGSPYAPYGGAGAATAALASATTEAALDVASELGARAVVYSGLTAPQADRLRNAATATGRGDVLDLGLTLVHTRPLGPAPDAWWEGIPARYRSEARRAWRRGVDAGLALAVHRGTDLPPYAVAFTYLANTTAAKHTGGARLYGPDHFRYLATVSGAVLLAALDPEGRMAGGFYGWFHPHNRCLYLWAAGVDYAHPAARHTYKWLVAEAAAWALEHAGAIGIDFGRGNHQVKARLGCRAQILRTVVQLPGRQPAVRGALARMSARLGAEASTYLPLGAAW